jgi:hypothetical protein
VKFGQDRKASKVWAKRIPTLRTTKNAVIASNIDGFLSNGFNKSSAFCTVQEIPLSGLNFPPHDDFEQHCAPSPRTFELGLNAKK